MSMRYRFGEDYELNTETQELLQGDRLIPLTPKAYAVLAYLLDNRDRLVSKEELLDEIWPETYVDDSAVKRNIMAVRRALGGGSSANAHIKTQRARGYRFASPVQVVTSEAEADVDAAPPFDPPAPPAPPAASPSPPISVAVETAERKLITALYCMAARLAGSDADLELDALHDLMQAVYACVYEEAQRYGGAVQHVTGEGCLILFGAPTALEDHARRAALTAWALRRRLPRQGGPLAWRMALHSGLVVVSPLPGQASEAASIVGDVTTLASAMARQAPQGAILASSATVALLQNDVRASPLAPPSIQELQAYEITHVAPQLSIARRLPTPFVGREAELLLLRARWRQAQAGQGQVVGIVGEPGIGKSRLLREFRAELTAIDGEAAYRRCDGRSYGCATPYLPILDLLRDAWSLADADDAQTLAAKVEAGLRAEGLEVETLAPYFCSLLGQAAPSEAIAGLSPDVLRARIFAALHAYFLRRGQTRPNSIAPSIIEVENAHWLDATSDAYFTDLIDRLAGAPVLLLITCRPGYRPAWLDKSYATQIALPPLGSADSREIVAAILGRQEADHAKGQQLLAKAGGNPFFLEELARAATEQEPAASARAVPNTVHAVLAERIDRLASAEKRLLQTAAVVGMEAPASLLQMVADLTEDAFDAHLRQLQASEFLYETRQLPESAYAFKHALTHDVAYASLLQSQRQRLHQRIVEVLERDSDRQANADELLARHALGGELWDKVCHYFARLGAHAMARSAYHEAITAYQQALHGLEQLPTEPARREQAVDLRLSLHAALLRSGNPERSRAMLGEAQAIAEALDDAYRLAWIASYLSTHHFMAGDMDGALSSGLRAQALAEMCEDDALHVDVRLHLGQAYHARGDYAAALAALAPNIEFVRQALRRQPSMLTPISGMHALPWTILCLAETGDFTQGESYIEEALRLTAMGENPYDQVAVDGSAGWLRLRRGDVEAALPLLERAMASCQAAGIAQMLPIVASFLGGAYLQMERRSEAIALLEGAVARAAAMRVMAYHALSLVLLGQAYRLDERLAEAKAQAERAIDLSQAQNDAGHAAWAYHLLGETLAQEPTADMEAAETAFQQALARAEAGGMRPLQAHCHLGLGLLYHPLDNDRGATSRAHGELAAAAALYRALEMPAWLARAESM